MPDQLLAVRDFVIATLEYLGYEFQVNKAEETIKGKIEDEETHDKHLAADYFLNQLEQSADVTLKPEVRKALLNGGLKLADLYSALHDAICSRPKEVAKKTRRKVPSRPQAEALAAAV